MKYQPNADAKSDDVVMTPLPLASMIVRHFKPTGSALEPCRGSGTIYHHLWCQVGQADWCEITEDRDFMDYSGKVAWIVTNPPWSQIQKFLAKSVQVADNIVFLMTVNHAMTTCRERIARQAGFQLKEIVVVDWPANFPKSGFLLGAVHWQRGWQGPITWTDLRVRP